MNKNNSSGSSKSVQVVKSPADFMAMVNNRWKIDWDLACTDENSQYDSYITERSIIQWNEEENSYQDLTKNKIPGSFGIAWYGLSKNYLFLNPPFCNAEPACEPDCDKDKCEKRGSHNLVPQLGINKWMEKCKYESKRGAKIITLTLASIGAGWYKEHVEGNANIWVLNGRLTFEGHDAPYPKDLMLCEWLDGMNSFGHLEWKKHIPDSFYNKDIKPDKKSEQTGLF